VAISLTAAGLTTETQTAIRAALVAAIRANDSTLEGLQFSAGTFDGAIADVWAERESAIQEAIAALYAAQGVDAEGAALDRVASTFGFARRSATRSTVTITVTNNGAGAITVPAGTQFERTSTGDVFALDASSGSIAPAGTANVACTAVVAGATPVPATMTLAWVTAGYPDVAISNASAGVQGLDDETDAAFRARVLLSRAALGGSTVDALYSALIALDGMTAARVVENTSLSTGVITPITISTLPPKSFVALVYGTADSDEIAQAIHDNRPAGIEAFGSTSTNVTDQQGQTVAVHYEVASADAQALTLTVTGMGGDDSYEDAAETAIGAYLASLDPGQTVSAKRLECAVLAILPETATDVDVDIGGAGANVDYTPVWNQYVTASGYTWTW